MTSRFKQWGDEAYWLLRAITGQKSTKKKDTLLALADAAYVGESMNNTFARSETSSKTAHYKWLEKDPAYKAAYEFMVGNEEAPGLALNRRYEELEEEEAQAVAALEYARRKLKMLSRDAVDVLADALTAESFSYVEDGGEAHYMPDHTNRRLAAKEILDRNPKTAANSKQDITSGGEKLSDWEGQIAALLINGRITADDVLEELGPEDARRVIARANLASKGNA